MESLIDLESAIRRLESSLDSLDWWLTFWTAVVVLGLLIEYAHDLWKLVWKRPFDWSLLRPVIGGILITLGVMGELFVGFKLSTVETALRAANDKVVAFLNRETSEAQRAAAEANEKAEQERLARVKIEEKLAPRTISSEQQDRIVEELKQLTGTPFTASVFNDPEALALLYTVLGMFQRAGWVQHPWKPYPGINTSYGVVGVSLSERVLFHVPSVLEQTASKTLTAFRFSDLSVRIMVDDGEQLEGKVHVEVGKKEITP